MKSVAIYARVSSDQQAQQATVGSQVAALQERARNEGYVVLASDVYVDDGYTGATLVRPAMEKLRDRAAEGRIDVLFVHSPDRLARRYAYQVVLLEELVRNGVKVQFLHGPSGQTAEDELLVQVQGMIAEYERAKILERCRRGRLHKARNGAVSVLSQAPYGYRYVRADGRDGGTFQVVLPEAGVIRSIFQWVVAEQTSLAEVTRRLTEQGIPTPTGRVQWDRATVWYMLRNPAYMGQAAFGKSEAVSATRLVRPARGRNKIPRHEKSSKRRKSPEDWVLIPVPPIISRETFEAANEQLDRNKRLSARNAKGERYLLQGLLVCAQCSHAFCGFTVTRKSSLGTKQYRYYRCCGNGKSGILRRHPHCGNPAIAGGHLESHVWASLCELMKDPSRLLQEWSQRRADDGVTAELQTQRDEARRTLASLENMLRRLQDAYEVAALDLSELTARSERIRQRTKSTQGELEKLEVGLAHTVELRSIGQRLIDFASTVATGLDGLTWHQRRHLIRTLVSRVEIDTDGASVIYRVPGVAVGRGPAGSSSDADRAGSPGIGVTDCVQQTPRRLQENATSNSLPQAEQRARKNPWAWIPHAR